MLQFITIKAFLVIQLNRLINFVVLQTDASFIISLKFLH